MAYGNDSSIGDEQEVIGRRAFSIKTIKNNFSQLRQKMEN